MTDRVTLECPNCQKTGILRVSPEVGGRLSVKCPRCGNVFEQHVDRRFSYRKIPLPWVFYGPAGSDDLPYIGWLSDLSMTGCRVRTEINTPIRGAWLDLEFRLDIDSSEIPAQERDALLKEQNVGIERMVCPLIRVRASVVWTNQVGRNHREFGCDFITIGDHARMMLSLYLYPFHEAIEPE
ncbi:MAG: PilZ domain-containing protein [Deltaproteobacteria bacterium]|nr:PilZ domain-containing protein [Deltaproteobacteria bacterium]